MTLWENLNLSELQCLLESGIKVYTYQVLGEELGYRKQLVDVALMKVRQVWEKRNEMKKMPVKQKLGQICTNCGVSFPLLFLRTEA